MLSDHYWDLWPVCKGRDILTVWPGGLIPSTFCPCVKVTLSEILNPSCLWRLIQHFSAVIKAKITTATEILCQAFTSTSCPSVYSWGKTSIKDLILQYFTKNIFSVSVGEKPVSAHVYWFHCRHVGNHICPPIHVSPLQLLERRIGNSTSEWGKANGLLQQVTCGN